MHIENSNWRIFVFSFWLLLGDESDLSFDQWKIQWLRNSLCKFCILFMLTCKIIMPTCASQVFVKYLTSYCSSQQQYLTAVLKMQRRCSYISIFLIYVSMWFLCDIFYANVHDINIIMIYVACWQKWFSGLLSMLITSQTLVLVC